MEEPAGVSRPQKRKEEEQRYGREEEQRKEEHRLWEDEEWRKEQERLEQEQWKMRERAEREMLKSRQRVRREGQEQHRLEERWRGVAEAVWLEQEERRTEQEKRGRLKLIREQEVKRQREAKVTLQFVAQDSHLATFGAGLGVKRIVPGFDLCRVTIRNLPIDATEKEASNLFRDQGLDDTMFKFLEFQEVSGSKYAKYLTRSEEAHAMAAALGLEDLEFRDNLLSLEVEANTPCRSMESSTPGANPHILTVLWYAPSITMTATYNTVEEARHSVRYLNGRKFLGRKLTAVLERAETSVKLGNICPSTSTTEVQALTETSNVHTIKSHTYCHTGLLDQLNAYLRMDGCLTASMQIADMSWGRVKGTVCFPSFLSLQKAAERLEEHNRQPGSRWPRLRVIIPIEHQYRIFISDAQYLAQKAQWDYMMQTAERRKAFIRIGSSAAMSGKVFVTVEGSDEKRVGELKVRVESLAAGERLGAEHWHSTYAYSGKALFDRVRRRTKVLVVVDMKVQALRLFGSSNILDAKALIRRDVERLELMEYAIPIERRSVRFFVSTGLPVLVEALGERNVSLDVGSLQSTLKLRGGDDAIKHAQKLIEEAISAVRGGLPIPSQGNTDENSLCPICYDSPTHPEVLSCGHQCCEPCLRHYLTSATTSNVFPLVCMGDNASCNTPISIPIIQRYLTEQRFIELVESAFSSYIQSNTGKFRYCTTPSCTQIYQCDTDRQFHQCPSCFSRICSMCNEEAHERMTCQERRIHSDPAEQDRLNNEWARASNAKRCPTCQAMTEKIEGCNHMTCRCGSHWCWVCRRAFPMGTIYTHMAESHGGIETPEPAAPQPQDVEVVRQRRAGDEARVHLGEERPQERWRRGRIVRRPQVQHNARPCPSCNILTERIGGNAISCRCGADWCWTCGVALDEAGIYPHMIAVHGGIDLPGDPATPAAQQEMDGLAERAQILGQRIELAVQRETGLRPEAHREMQRQMTEVAARIAAQNEDSWCSLM